MHRYGKEKAEAAWMLLYLCEMERVALLHDEVDGQRPAPEWRRAVMIVEGKLADDDVLDVAVMRPWSFCYHHGLLMACLARGLALLSGFRAKRAAGKAGSAGKAMF